MGAISPEGELFVDTEIPVKRGRMGGLSWWCIPSPVPITLPLARLWN
jgi:hypothetical protein